MESSSPKESKEVNLTSVLYLVQKLYYCSFCSKKSRIFGDKFQLVCDAHLVQVCHLGGGGGK